MSGSLTAILLVLTLGYIGMVFSSLRVNQNSEETVMLTCWGMIENVNKFLFPHIISKCLGSQWPQTHCGLGCYIVT